MGGIIQVGTVAMRDPVTGDFMPSVPLYIREEDRDRLPQAPVFDGELMRTLAEKFKAYKKEERKQKKAKAAAKSTEEIGKWLDTMLEEYEEQKKIR